MTQVRVVISHGITFFAKKYNLFVTSCLSSPQIIKKKKKKKKKEKKRKKNGGEGGREQQVMNLSSRFGLSNLLYTFGTNLTLNLLDLIILNCSGHFKDLFCFFKFHLFTWL